jgi:hypothetical protein
VAIGLGLAMAFSGCGGEPEDSDSGTGGSDGNPSTGGTTSSTGGTDGGGGTDATTGGTGTLDGTGGALDGTGGQEASGGNWGTGGADTGTCQKGTTQGNEVLFIGESFVAASAIPEETTKLARAAGSLAQNDSYLDESVSGMWMGNGAPDSIPNQYRNHSDGIRFVLMNGGGNDCWQGGQAQHRTAALSAAAELFDDMDENGVEKIVYFFYPDPIGNQHANLTACLNLLRPEMKALCDSQVSPQCFWVDLRETWNGHPEYALPDGIHVAPAGEAPTAGAIFDAMEANCVAP